MYMYVNMSKQSWLSYKCLQMLEGNKLECTLATSCKSTAEDIAIEREAQIGIGRASW